jgi:acyl carrier protein
VTAVVMPEAEVRRQLKRWIAEHAKNTVSALSDDTPILEQGILSSLDIVEFVLYIESLRGVEVDTEAIAPEAFASVNALFDAFFRF